MAESSSGRSWPTLRRTDLPLGRSAPGGTDVRQSPLLRKRLRTPDPLVFGRCGPFDPLCVRPVEVPIGQDVEQPLDVERVVELFVADDQY